MTLARRTPLKAKKPMARGKPMGRPKPSPKARPKEKAEPRASKLPTSPKRQSRGAPRDAGFLDFVRAQPCLYCGTSLGVEAHHFGKRGKGTKCSDYETVPLCHEHHVEGWHRHGTLPGMGRAGWLERFRFQAVLLLEMYAPAAP